MVAVYPVVLPFSYLCTSPQWGSVTRTSRDRPSSGGDEDEKCDASDLFWPRYCKLRLNDCTIRYASFSSCRDSTSCMQPTMVRNSHHRKSTSKTVPSEMKQEICIEMAVDAGSSPITVPARPVGSCTTLPLKTVSIALVREI